MHIEEGVSRGLWKYHVRSSIMKVVPPALWIWNHYKSFHLMSTYHVSGTVLNLYMCYSTKSSQPPFGTYYYCLHFKDLEIEAQQVKSFAWHCSYSKWQSPESNSGQSTSVQVYYLRLFYGNEAYPFWGGMILYLLTHFQRMNEDSPPLFLLFMWPFSHIKWENITIKSYHLSHPVAEHPEISRS